MHSRGCLKKLPFPLMLAACLLAPLTPVWGQDTEQADWAALVMAMESSPASDATLALNRRFLQRHARSTFRPAAECMQAEIFFRRRQYSSALPVYSRLLADPAAVPFQDAVLFRQGESYANFGNPGQAKNCWQTLIRDIPGSYLLPEVTHAEAVLNLKQAKYEAAAEACRRLLAQYPRYAGRSGVVETLAWLDLAAQKFPDAIRRLEGADTQGAVFLKGVLHFLMKNYSAAVSDFYELSRFSGRQAYRPLALFLKADAAWQMQDPELAAENFAAFGEQYPDSPLASRARLKLAALDLLQGKWADAWQLANALPLSDLPGIRPFQLNYLKAEILGGLGRYAEAAEYLRQILAEPAAQNLKATVLLKYAWTLYRAQQYGTALEAANQYLRSFAREEQAPWAHFLASHCQYHLGWLDQSLQNNLAVLQRFPASPVQPLAALCLQSLQLKAQRADLVISQTAAIQNLSDPVQNQKYDIRALTLLLLGWAYTQNQQSHEAIRLFEKILTHYKGTQAAPWAQALLLEAGFNAGQYVKTLAQAQMIATDLNWEERLRQEALLVQGHCQLKLKRYAQAADAYQSWLQNDKSEPEKPAVFYLLGLAYYGLRNCTQARQYWEQAVADTSRNGSARQVLLSIANAYFNSGDYALARSNYQSFLRRYGQDPSSDVVHLRIAQAYYKEGKDLEAMKTFQTYLRISAGRGSMPPVPTPAAIEAQLNHSRSNDHFVFPVRNRFERQVTGFREIAAGEMDRFFSATLGNSATLARPPLPAEEVEFHARSGQSSASPLPASPWLSLLTQDPVLSLRIPKMPGFTSWKFSVWDAAGNTLNLQSGQGRLPDRVLWDGRNLEGRRFPVGNFFQYGMTLLPSAGKPLMTLSGPVQLENLTYSDPQQCHILLLADKLFAPEQPALLTAFGRACLHSACDILRQKGWEDIRVRIYSSRGADRESQAESVSALICEDLDLLPAKVAREVRPADGSGPGPKVEISSQIAKP